MRNIKFYHIYILLIAIIYSSCEVSDPMESEQYRKDVYIIGANEKVKAFNLPYGDKQETFISLAISGTHKIDRDVTIKLGEKDGLIEWYNNKFLLDDSVKYHRLNSDLFTIPSWEVTLKAGEIHTNFPFTINSSALHCDSLYAITFAIESVSDYQISESGNELIFTLQLTNPYSGEYNMDAKKFEVLPELQSDGSTQWVEQGGGSTVNVMRILTACSANEVRFFHDATKQKLSEYSDSWNPNEDYFNAIKNSCIKFVRNGDSNTFRVESWDAMNILEGEADFKEEKIVGKEKNSIVYTFSFWYDYMDGATRRRMKGTFKREETI